LHFNRNIKRINNRNYFLRSNPPRSVSGRLLLAAGSFN